MSRRGCHDQAPIGRRGSLGSSTREKSNSRGPSVSARGRINPLENHRRFWFCGIIPNWPWPWPATGVFHGIMLLSDTGPTGLVSDSSAQEERPKPAMTARSMRDRLRCMDANIKQAPRLASLRSLRRKNYRVISWSSEWRGSPGHPVAGARRRRGFASRSRRWFESARLRMDAVGQ